MIWREYGIDCFELFKVLSAISSFGGGFELLRDGDVNGIWKLMSDRGE